MEIKDAELSFAWGLTLRTQTTHLIIHHAAGYGTVEDIHEYHLNKGWAGIAYHFYIRLNGEIWRGRPVNYVGGHTRGMNYTSIGICFEGNFNNDYMSKEQLTAGDWLIDYIKSLYPDILVSKHKDFEATACPGEHFPFDEMLWFEPEPNESVEENNEPSEWAEKECRYMIELGLIKGDPDGKYRWREPITREEMCVLMYRVLTKYVKE